MKMQESKFGAPKGFNYLGKFQGCYPFKSDGPPRLGDDGKPMGPALEWQWEITHDPDHNGEFVGKIVSRITQDIPTVGNSCGKLLAGVVGKTVQELLADKTRDYEPNDHLGLTYQLVIDASKKNAERTQVMDCRRVQTDTGKPPVTHDMAPQGGLGGQAVQAAPRAAAPPSRPGNGPPPAVGTGKPACDPAEPWVWRDPVDGKEYPTTRAELFKMVRDDPKNLDSMVRRPGPGQSWVKVEATDLSIPF